MHLTKSNTVFCLFVASSKKKTKTHALNVVHLIYGVETVSEERGQFVH